MHTFENLILSKNVVGGTYPIAPTHANVVYGPYERNKLDIFIPNGSGPFRTVVYFHGGGFTHGDKTDIKDGDLTNLLSRGIAVVPANYRYIQQGVMPAPQQDATRVIQFLRYYASPYNFIPNRVGVLGGSAGGSMALTLATQPDKADPSHSDPINRTSSIVKCVASSGGQVTFKHSWWATRIPLWTYPNTEMMELFGATTEEEADTKNLEVAALELTNQNTSIIYINYGNNPDEAPPIQGLKQWQLHHSRHGVDLKVKLDAFGRENYLKHPGSTTPDPFGNPWKFLVAKL